MSYPDQSDLDSALAEKVAALAAATPQPDFDNGGYPDISVDLA